MRRSLTIPNELAGTAGKVIAFCGIARPDEFFSALIARNINVELAVTFADHHRYSREDMNRLKTAAAEAHADAFVTTEKDAVRLDPSMLQVLESAAPVRVARLEVSLRDEPSVIQQLRPKLPSLTSCPRKRLISRRSRFEGLPAGIASNCAIALRSAATLSRNSRLASVSRYSVCATAAGPRTSLNPSTST